MRGQRSKRRTDTGFPSKTDSTLGLGLHAE
jgi:hypothetical protein